jgi:inorganic pyrophosphatase
MYSKNDFWSLLDKLVEECEIVIDRPKGSKHPKMESIYPLDYGYLKDTKSMDNSGIDLWKGSKNSTEINGIICTIDLYKRDSEIKILIGCTSEDIKTLEKVYDDFETLKGLLILR